ncbi:MAG: hypothetical protein AB7S81_00195 [Bdellovibrionales bacterium]
MTLSNRLQLDDLPNKTHSEIAACDVEELALLVEDLEERKKHLKAIEMMLSLSLDLKYAGIAHKTRQKEGKDTGSARFDDGAFTIIANLPKRVKWDQKQLSLVANTIYHDWHEEPSEYMQSEYKVSEAAFNAWPKAVRDLFAGARRVETGKPSYQFDRKDGERV